ncbi:MAG: ABC transporter ATP-binding protein [Planctomycetes bacterium]|nr:ABC transporter ATP-binding protein [Planctomycetota bacterium]
MSETPRPEVTNLVEIEERREELRRRLRIWHLFLPASGDDLRAYRSLLRFVKPYRGKFALSILMALLSAIFVGAELGILQGGLSKILGAPTPAELVAGGGKAPPPSAVGAGEQDPGDLPAPPLVAPAPPTGPDATGPLGDRFLERARWKAYELQKWLYWKLDLEPPDPPQSKAQKAHVESQRVVLAPELQAKRRRMLWFFAIVLIVAVLLASASKYGQSVLMNGVSRRVVRDVRSHLFKHVMSLSIRFHQKNHSAQLISRITGDLEVFGRFLTEALVRFVQDFLDFSAMMFFITLNGGAFIFVIAGVMGAAIAPVNAIARKLRKRDRQNQAGMAEIAIVITEALTGQRVVKAFASEDREYKRFRDASRVAMKVQMHQRRLRSLTEPVVMGIGAIGIATIMVWGGERVLAGSLDSTGFVMNVLALARAMAGLRGMSKQLNDFQLGLAAADRVGTVLSARSEISEKPDAIALPPFSREIRFNDVRFCHEGVKPTLNGIDLVIKKGEKVALVGPSGAGKTTFIDLVPRFFDVDGGSITIDGHDLRDLNLRSLREQIGIVSQETILFRDSIRDNIAYGKPDATDEEVFAAARAANAHGFITRAPRGYSTPVGERGFRLSGGERQRIAIARAILRDPPILILDEATSALDSESEAVVQAALQQLMVGRTVIMIAHRLSTVRDADKIVVLERGRIVEMGSHDELSRKPGGSYRRHWKIQNRRLVEHDAERADGRDERRDEPPATPADAAPEATPDE